MRHKPSVASSAKGDPKGRLNLYDLLTGQRAWGFTHKNANSNGVLTPNQIVEQAIKHDLVKGKIVYTDSTHIKANVSLSKFENEDFIIEEEEDPQLLERINEKRESKGKNPF